LSRDGDQFFSQSSFGLGEPELGDRFGASLSSGDFDGDGFSDLAVGVPGEDVGGIGDAGQVQVIFGGVNGLVLGGTQDFNGNEPNDRFGTVLTWANFGRGPQGDLAVGSPEEDVAGLFDAGEVQVLYGSPTGLDGTNKQVINQTKGSLGPAEAFDRFGAALAAGDLGKTGLAELAVGARGEDLGPPRDTIADAGAVQVLYGAGSGLQLNNATLLTDTQPEAGDQFGFAMATGNFNGLAKKDLAIGMPGEDLFVEDFGVVALAFGQDAGIGKPTTFIIDRQPEEGDQFGRALAANDFDLDGLTDLAVGVPFEDFETNNGAIVDSGAVLTFRGTSTGRPQQLQTIRDVFGQASDKFGVALTAWDFGAGPAPDLAVGVPFDNPFIIDKPVNDAGSVQAFYSSGDPSAPIDLLSRDFFTQGRDLPEVPEPGDQFGGAVY
jgi:hypothetical protein